MTRGLECESASFIPRTPPVLHMHGNERERDPAWTHCSVSILAGILQGQRRMPQVKALSRENPSTVSRACALFRRWVTFGASFPGDVATSHLLFCGLLLNSTDVSSGLLRLMYHLLPSASPHQIWRRSTTCLTSAALGQKATSSGVSAQHENVCRSSGKTVLTDILETWQGAISLRSRRKSGKETPARCICLLYWIL